MDGLGVHALPQAVPMLRSQDVAVQQRQRREPVARPTSVTPQSNEASPLSPPLIVAPLPAAVPAAGGEDEASGVGRAAALVAIDIFSQPGGAPATILTAAPTVAGIIAAGATAAGITAAGTTAAGITAAGATAAGITAAGATAVGITAAGATAAGITAAGATAVGTADVTKQGPTPSPMTIHGSKASETVTVPQTKLGDVPRSIVMALVLPAVNGGGHPGVDEGGSRADHGVGGPSLLADSSVRCKPISEPLPPALMQALPPTMVSSAGDNSDKLLGVKAEALVTMKRSMHDPVGVGLCNTELSAPWSHMAFWNKRPLHATGTDFASRYPSRGP